jgi:hypothetical protein
MRAVHDKVFAIEDRQRDQGAVGALCLHLDCADGGHVDGIARLQAGIDEAMAGGFVGIDEFGRCPAGHREIDAGTARVAAHREDSPTDRKGQFPVLALLVVWDAHHRTEAVTEAVDVGSIACPHQACVLVCGEDEAALGQNDVGLREGLAGQIEADDTSVGDRAVGTALGHDVGARSVDGDV